MTLMQRTVEAALKDRAPKLYADLKAEGKLTAFVREKAGEINSSVVQATMEARMRGGWDKQNLPLPEMVGRMNAARASATEIALDEALQFPPEGTSSPSQG